SPELSDALCRLSTGAGFGTKANYTDDEECLFSGRRPILLNGITELATRSDLLDRSIVVTLPAITGKKRREDSEYWADFNEALPRMLGGLCSAVSTAMKRLPDVHLPEPPRMADFARWSVAAEPAFGVAEGTFLEAYKDNRERNTEAALDACPIVGPLKSV